MEQKSPRVAGEFLKIKLPFLAQYYNKNNVRIAGGDCPNRYFVSATEYNTINNMYRVPAIYYHL